MSSGITFTDKEEAIEYAKQMRSKGYNTTMRKQDKNFIVYLAKRNWEEIQFEPDEERHGYIYPEKGIIAASSKPSLEHEKAHIELGHVTFGERLKRRRDSLADLKREMDAYAYPLAKGRLALRELIDEWNITSASDEEKTSLIRQLGKSLVRLKNRQLITTDEYQNTKEDIQMQLG